MRMTRLHRTVVLVASAALLSSMTAATVAAPASAAKPKCQGKTATIVGTRKAEVIRGTARRDVIVAKGGHDRIYGRGGNDLICAGGGNDTVYGGPGADTIWGQLGNDRLFGNAGPDFLAGQVGNDPLNGGIGVDKCYQGTGGGARVACELPAQPAAPAPLAPPPPPEPPTLVIAYSDVNNNQIYDGTDVMIAKIVDTTRNGAIDAGDTIKMGHYPTSPAEVTTAGLRQNFEPWGVKTHTVTAYSPGINQVRVDTTVGGTHWWYRTAGTNNDEYEEDKGGQSSHLDDYYPPDGIDLVRINPSSPSQPASSLSLEGPGNGDDGFIDVIIYVDLP